MKSQKILSLLLVLGLVSCCFMFCGFTFFKKNVKANETKTQTVQNYSTVQNDLWCVTFQLVWNEFMDKITNGNPVQFVGGNPQIADELNKKNYTKEILSSNSYYIEQGKISKSLKRKIERNIKWKFNEKSDVLDFIDWDLKDSYLFYAMLKKNFTYKTAFDKLSSQKFNNSTENYKYFGVNRSSDKKLRENVNVLFYNSPEEYAVRLLTKEKEDVILFRTDRKDSFENLYAYVKDNSKNDEFTKMDTLKVPQLAVDKTLSYTDLTGKQIQGTRYFISQALQTIKFNLDEKGGSLKSEAVIGAVKMSLMPNMEKPRYFNFDKPFVLYLVERGKDKPYYAMNVSTTDYLVKE